MIHSVEFAELFNFARHSLGAVRMSDRGDCSSPGGYHVDLNIYPVYHVLGSI